MHLLRLTTKDLFGGGLQLALVREIGHVRRVLVDGAQLASHLSLVATEDGVVLGVSQALEFLRALAERILGFSSILWHSGLPQRLALGFSGG